VPSRPRPFLTARWSNLVLLTFEAAEPLVRGHLPPGVAPDRWNGATHVSLVALQLSDIRVLGWRVPGFAAHPQVNFRTYVRYRGEPGVCFLRQLVPSRLIAAVGRWRYGEPFRAMPVRSRVAAVDAEVRAEYGIGPEATGWHVRVTGSQAARVPSPDSAEHYFTERVLGCRAGRGGELTIFRVEHPPWAVRAVRAVECDVDFGRLYGREWSFLNERPPVSVVFAVGSDVAVYDPYGFHQ